MNDMRDRFVFVHSKRQQAKASFPCAESWYTGANGRNVPHFFGSALNYIGLHRTFRNYRQCQIKKKDLEQDVATLATEKEQLGTETKSLEKRKAELEMGNRWIERTITKTKAANEQLTEENAQLAKNKKLLVEYNSTLKETVVKMIEEYKGLETSKEKALKGGVGS